MTEQERIRNRILKSGKLPMSPTAASPAAAGAFTPTAMFEKVTKTPATSYASALANATVPKTTPKYNTSYARTFAEISSPKTSTPPTSYKDIKLPQSEMTYGDLEALRPKATETAKKIAEENAKAKVENDPFWKNYSTVPKPVGEGDSADMIFTPKDSSAKDVAMVSLSGTKNNGALYMPEGWEDIKEISPQRMIAVVPKIGNKVTEQFYSVKQPIETELNELYADLDELDARIYPHRHTLSISTTEEDKAAVREVLVPLEAEKTELEKKIAEKEARFQEVKSLERLLIYNEYQNVLKNDPESKRKIIDGQRIDGDNTLLKGHDAYLTPDERQIYYYIVAEYGKVEARKFLSYFEDELRFRKAQFEYEYIDDDPDGWLKKAALVYGGSFVDAVTGAWGGIKQFFSDKPVEKPYIVDVANYIKAQETGAAGVAYDVLGTLGYMTPAMLTATLTGTGVAGNLFTYLSASGNAYSEKIKQGYSPAEAKIYSNLVGAAEAGLQYALGGISKLGKGANTGLIAQKIGSIENAFVRASTDLAYRGLKEITEEELQLFLEPFISSMVFDEKYDAPTMEEMLYTALISFATTGIFEIPEIAGEYSALRNNNKADKKLDSRLRSDNSDVDGETTSHTYAENNTDSDIERAEEEALDFEDDTDAMYSEPPEELDGRSFEELMGLDGTGKSTSTSKVPEIKLPTAEDILSGNYTPATPVTTPVEEIKLKTGEEIVAEERAEEEALDFEDDTDAMYSEPSEEFDGRSFEELMGLDGTEKSTSTSKVPEIKLPTAEDILSGNYTPATPVTPPVKEIKPMTDEEARASVWGEETPPSEDIDFENVDFENEADMPRKYDFTVDKSAVSERFSRMLEARQNTLDELISQRYNIEESFNDEISYLEMQYRDMKNPEITKKGIALSKRITKLKEQRDTRLAEMDAQIEKARKRVDDLDEKEYSRMVQRRTIEQERQDFISRTVGSTVNWKDKPGGAFLYDLNTLRRNLRDIVRDANGKPNIELADRIYDMLQGAYSRHEAQMKQELLSIADKFAALKINNAESTYIQMLGELRSNPDTTLTQEEVEEFYRDHKKKIDTDKVEKAVAMARETYDSLFNRLNEVLREQGMKEIPYRQGYFPHYTKEKNGFFAKLLNWKSKNNSLPTDIAGLTEEFNPKKSYQPFDKRREGDTTEYNFLEGLDNYVRGALDWIYHIEDIALRRSFEDYIRYEHSEKAMRDKIDDIRSEGLDPEEERVLIDDALKGRAHQLGNFLASFRAQTNVLAGKKHSGDRTVEQEFGRGTYSFAQNVSSRINGNMVAANVASALTNFIPLTQSWAEVSPKQTLIAMKDTLKSFKHDDGIREKSVFLTNRLTEDKRLYQTGWDKASDKAAALMGAIDSFTSETIWRSKYAQNLEKGMSEDEAIANADDYCAGLIASRSRGEMPGTFDKKNVFAKVLTSFQLEVNNQYGYLFKDLPKNKETKLGVVWGLVKMFLGAYGFNWLYEKITGRRPALDPIGMVAAFIDDIAEDDEDKWMNLSESLLEQVPFVGGLFGGGRIPLQSAVPDVNNMNDIESIVWELAKPAAYLALPTGGGQLYKTAKGIDAIAKGGSYKTDSKGNEILQYPYYSDEGANSIFQGTKAVLFGKNSLPTAGDWVDSGFESLNTDQTKAYEGMISAGDKQRKSYEFINKLKSLETTKDKRQALNDSDFSDEAKYSVYYYMLADKNENDPEKDERYAVLDNLEDHSAINTILAVETSEDNHGKIQAVANAQLTSNDRALIIKEYISEDAYFEATDLTRKGLTYDEYFDAYFIWDKIKADNKDSKVRRTEFAHWLNKNGKNMNSTERAALREALIGEGETSYDKLVGAGMSDKGAYEVGLKLDKLDPDPYSTYKTVQPYQKYRVIVNSSLSDRDTVSAMKAISTDAQAQKIQKLSDSGIDLNLFARLSENIGKAGKSVWSVSNSELRVWIDRLTPPALGLDAPLTWPKIKSTMYSILTANKNDSSVPSSTHVKMVLDKHYGRTK